MAESPGYLLWGDSMKTIAEIKEEYRALIEGNREMNEAGALALRDNIERSPLYFRGRLTTRTVQVPRLYSEADIRRFREIVKIAHGIFEKVIREYLAREEYRALFPFSPELEVLILASRGEAPLLPMARCDIFYHEDTGDFHFCEVNTDGTSGMNEDRLLDEFLIDNPAHQEMRRRYRFHTMELFDRWVRCFLSLYERYERKVAEPNVAIVDFLDKGTLREFQEFARHFQKAGVNCEIVDIRDLRFADGRLQSPAGHAIDAVYRRAVTSDIMVQAAEVQPFLRAMRENACFVAGSFATQIIHHKWLFHVLHLPRTMQFLAPMEQDFVRAHIPRTVPFEKKWIALSEVLAQRERYILKPEDSYASHGVWAGVEFPPAAWEAKARSVYGKGYICQEYCPQYVSENIDFAWGDGQWHPYISMAGLYVYDGEFAGVYARLAEGNGIIASYRNERTQPAYIVTER